MKINVFWSDEISRNLALKFNVYNLIKDENQSHPSINAIEHRPGCFSRSNSWAARSELKPNLPGSWNSYFKCWDFIIVHCSWPFGLYMECSDWRFNFAFCHKRRLKQSLQNNIFRFRLHIKRGRGLPRYYRIYLCRFSEQYFGCTGPI